MKKIKALINKAIKLAIWAVILHYLFIQHETVEKIFVQFVTAIHLGHFV